MSKPKRLHHHMLTNTRCLLCRYPALARQPVGDVFAAVEGQIALLCTRHRALVMESHEFVLR